MGVYALISLKSRKSPPSHFFTHFPLHLRVSAKSTFFVFTAPPSYQFLFWPSSGCSWYSLMCRGNAAPRGIPPPCLRPPLVPNFTLTNWPRVPLPLTSPLFSMTTWSSTRVCWPSLPSFLKRSVGSCGTDTLVVKLCAKKQRAEKSRTGQGEGRRERGRGRQRVGGRWGIFGWK